MAKQDWAYMNINFFKTQEIDYLMSRKGGSSYVVIYQMLHLMTLNNDGVIANCKEQSWASIAENIAHKCNYFNCSIVKHAIKNFLSLELLVILDDGTVQLTREKKYWRT